MSLPDMNQPFVVGSIEGPVGAVPQVSSSLVLADRLGSMKARWGVGRMHFTVDPGLYALGRPHDQSPVLVTANYKMTFDRLRESLQGIDAWILVLDTKGINVWCAAGKGTFCTPELVHRIDSTGLARVVTHRQLILPQLSAPGVAAHQAKRLSGFKVIYGPIKAKDLPAFLNSGLKATPQMRLKTFTLWERVVLIPVELVGALKVLLIIVPILLVISGLLGPRGFWTNMVAHGLFAIPALLTAVAAGAVLTPVLLPWLPGRAFSIKGLIMGLVTAPLLLAFQWVHGGRLETTGWLVLILAATTYLAMNFTGASTYTSLSGVRKEMRWALPLEIIGGIVGLSLWFWSMFTA